MKVDFSVPNYTVYVIMEWLDVERRQLTKIDTI